MAVTLDSETKKRLLPSIKQYVAKNLEQEIGDLQAGLLLDYFLREIAPSVYNQAIRDAQAHLQERVSDLESVCFEKEFDYWPDRAARSRTKP